MAIILRRIRFLEICFLILFITVFAVALVSSVVFQMSQLSFSLLLLDFPIALVVAFLASLSIREEEEEKDKEYV